MRTVQGPRVYPQDMENDENRRSGRTGTPHQDKMARGNLRKAKKLYCGVGPQQMPMSEADEVQTEIFGK